MPVVSGTERDFGEPTECVHETPKSGLRIRFPQAAGSMVFMPTAMPEPTAIRMDMHGPAKVMAAIASSPSRNTNMPPTML